MLLGCSKGLLSERGERGPRAPSLRIAVAGPPAAAMKCGCSSVATGVGRRMCACARLLRLVLGSL
jgi:hypothetical protein